MITKRHFQVTVRDAICDLCGKTFLPEYFPREFNVTLCPESKPDTFVVTSFPHESDRSVKSLLDQCGWKFVRFHGSPLLICPVCLEKPSGPMEMTAE